MMMSLLRIYRGYEMQDKKDDDEYVESFTEDSDKYNINNSKD